MRVVVDVVQRLAEHILGTPSQDFYRFGIDEGSSALVVDPVNPLSRGIENELVGGL